ncbi:MAG: hypothetical protein JRJ12_15020, partial [Deltaproteobacteria bacterium]|nr:hypothetical protein [Deltaproteobacteria bacterium]
AFADLPDDLAGPQNEKHRRKLAQYFVQRRRANIRHYMKTATPFPERQEAEESYTLGEKSAYKRLFDKVLRYARESVRTAEGRDHRQRV